MAHAWLKRSEGATNLTKTGRVFRITWQLSFVLVDDPRLLPDLRSDVDGVIQCQRPFRDPLLERLPLVVRHDEIELPVVCLVDLVDGADVEVVQSSFFNSPTGF